MVEMHRGKKDVFISVSTVASQIGTVRGYARLLSLSNMSSCDEADVTAREKMGNLELKFWRCLLLVQNRAGRGWTASLGGVNRYGCHLTTLATRYLLFDTGWTDACEANDACLRDACCLHSYHSPHHNFRAA